MTVHDDWKYGRGPNKGKMKPKSLQRGMRWRVTFVNPKNKNGVGERFFDNKEEANSFDAKKKEERRTGVHVDEKAGQQLVETFAWAWLDSLHLKPRSLKEYERLIRLHIVPFFGCMRMIEVQRTDVNTWVKQKRAAGYAASTIYGMYDLLFAMFKAAVIDGVRGASPCVKITNLPSRPKRGDKKRKWLPTRVQVMALVRVFDARFRLAVRIAAGCGLRFSEVMGLTVDDFDFDGLVVRVRRALSEDCDCGATYCMQTTKSDGSMREVSMPASVAVEIKAHIAAGYTRPLTLTDHAVELGQQPAMRDMTLMFSTATGKPMSRSAWRTLWNAAIEAAGTALADAPKGRDGFTLHTLRHNYASLRIAGGASLVEVQEAMGHASPMVTLNAYTWPVGQGNSLGLVDAIFDDETDLAA